MKIEESSTASQNSSYTGLYSLTLTLCVGLQVVPAVNSDPDELLATTVGTFLHLWE
jgi:hypothetical protein